ncbi:uncharacterized protein LOC129263825 [Lytechinus pictus]|uniref:uncharacterized protein LOC129263825 n=1 Tax=Lytechinus pictus TaxID=7653 RepID=UPI0030B9E3EF
MGCTHSRSEDLYKKSIINSETFIGSITETPGYFSRTVHTLDFLENKFPNRTKTEMSYTGPPSHLQNSIDVHPFWSEFGREFQPTDRYNDMSNGDVPRGLLPGTDTAQEMRNLEQKESMKDLRNQVKAKLAQVRPIPEEEREEPSQPLPGQGMDEVDSVIIPPLPPSESVQTKSSESKRPESPKRKTEQYPLNISDSTLDKEAGSFQAERAALDLLDSVIMDSMNLEDGDDEEDVVVTPPVIEDSNWSLGTESFMKVEMRRRNLDKPVPGVMLDTSNRNSQNVLRSSMYLPDANFMNPHSAAAKSTQNTSVLAYRLEADHRNALDIRPRPKSSLGFPTDKSLSNGLSNNSIDTGVFSDSGTTNSASSNDSGIGSGGGVRDLVKIYNEQTRTSTVEPSWKRHSANLDNYGRGAQSRNENLPKDNDPVPKHSAILDEIRKELQLNLSS